MYILIICVRKFAVIIIIINEMRNLNLLFERQVIYYRISLSARSQEKEITIIRLYIYTYIYWWKK